MPDFFDKKASALINPLMRKYGLREAPDLPFEISDLSDDVLKWVGVEAALEKLTKKVDEPAERVYKNILNPSKETSVKEAPQDTVKDYLVKVSKVLSSASSLPKDLLYTLLYAIYEPLWYMTCKPEDEKPCTPVASDAIPTRTVFDEGRAAATAINWANGEGLLIRVDVAGIQSFISVARKAGDLWAGSWLVSALTWYTVAEVVRALGPDTVVSPALEFNPFFYSSLIKWLESEGASKDLVEEVRKIMEFFGYDGAPEQPVMPGTAYLAIPCSRVDGIGNRELEELVRSCDPGLWRDYFAKRFREGWGKLVGGLINLSNCGNEPVCGLLKSMSEKPPLLLRVTAVRVRDVLDELKQGINGFKVITPESVLLHYAWHKKLREASAGEGWAAVKLMYASPLGREILEFTERAYLAGERLDRCTVCGVEPAITDSGTAASVLSGPDLKLILKDGEKLGPYCLIKRLVASRPGQAAGALGMEWKGKKVGDEEYKRRVMTSTTELAAAKAIAAFLKAVTDSVGIEEECGGVVYWLPESVWREVEAIDRGAVKNRRKYATLYALSLCPEKEDVLPLYDVITSGRREVIDKFVDCIKEKIGAPEEVIRGALDSARRVLRRYYTIIKGDGDFFGSRLLRGCLDMNPSKYVTESLGPGYAINDAGARDYENDVRRLGDVSGTGCVTTPVTLTYIKALSRAMMIVALRDTEIVKRYGGVTVYAGGDDLMAMAPAWISRPSGEEPASVGVTIDTRLSYWGLGNGPSGLIVVGERGDGKEDAGAVFPAPAVYGRSYGVVIAHHKDPLRSAVDLSNELEELKDEISTNGWEKDSVAVFYGRLGSVALNKVLSEAALIPNKLRGGTDGEVAVGPKAVRELALAVSRGSFSRSLIHDMLADDVLEALPELAGKCMADRLIEYVLRRNESREGAAEELLGRVGRDLLNTVMVVGGEGRPVAAELAKAGKAVYSGRR